MKGTEKQIAWAMTIKADCAKAVENGIRENEEFIRRIIDDKGADSPRVAYYEERVANFRRYGKIVAACENADKIIDILKYIDHPGVFYRKMNSPTMWHGKMMTYADVLEIC